jgi:hypothetical protein
MFDGTVVPSFLANDVVSTTQAASGFSLNLNEYALRLGQVTQVIPPNSPDNRGGKHYEYEVLAFVSDGRGNMISKTYYNCVVSDIFGSVADSFTYTQRKSTATNPSNFYLSKGSNVAILCVNGSTFQPLIVGGYPNAGTQPPTEDLGHHLSFEFNGVQFNIDKDGQVTIKRRGPTNDDGTVVSDQEANGGATVLMTSDGSVSVQSGNGNHVKVDLDATNGSLNLSCTEGVIINSGQYSMVRGETIKDSVATLVQGVIDALNAIPAGGPGSAAVLPASKALAQFQADTSFLSAKNKVD